MIEAYLRFLSRSAHDTEYKFFKSFKYRAGTAVVVGYDGGKSLSTFRLYNQTYNLVQFEKNVFLQRQIRAMSWIAGKEFAYHMVKLSNQQCAETLFIPRVKGKLQESQASLNPQSVQSFPSADASAAIGSLRDTDFSEAHAEIEADEDESQNAFKEIVVDTRIFDTFNIRADIVIINENDFNMGILEGMDRTINNTKPIFMLPNIWPLMFDAHEFLVARNYLPYLFNPKKNTIRPLKSASENKNVLFVHKGAFETTKEVKM